MFTVQDKILNPYLVTVIGRVTPATLARLGSPPVVVVPLVVVTVVVVVVTVVAAS